MTDCDLNSYYSNNKPDGVSRYNAIPEKFVKGKILDIGCSDGIAQINSKYADKFKSKDYLGLEPESERATYAIKLGLSVLLTTIDDYNFDIKYDLIIMNEVLAHIDLEDWVALFEKLKSMLTKDGVLCITTIVNEKTHDVGDRHRYLHHVVLNITDAMVLRYLPDAQIKKIPAWHAFKQKDETFIWALSRWIKRIVTRHHAVGIIFPVRRERMYLFKNPPTRRALFSSD